MMGGTQLIEEYECANGESGYPKFGSLGRNLGFGLELFPRPRWRLELMMWRL
ncbi:hypothetical protein Ahy_A01g002913 isoform C [Arachis hypogaea]|uniref:Uncharacterized protein n=1 Tax=Arachis hypogaea TaxID=3818 RepID=A0A445ES08_ARAHY|nr:hypothetical protein Ahy_A01g002913 isoform C [Arachis hypogaea]